MLVSYNEVLLTCRKALEALGWAQGDWEDGADAVAWLTLHGTDGVKMLAACAEQLRSPYDVLLKRTKNVFDAQGQSCLRVGPSVIDWCFADSTGEGEQASLFSTAFIHNCTEQLFLLPYCWRTAQRGRLVIATWQDERDVGAAWQLRAKPDTQMPVLSRYVLATDAERVSGVHLLLAQDVTFAMPTPDGELSGMVSAEFETHAQRNLTEGIEVDDDAWQTVQTLAKGILVPETETSRQRGAGETGGT